MSDIERLCGKRLTLGHGSNAVCELPVEPSHEWHEMEWDTFRNERVIWRSDVKYITGGSLGEGMPTTVTPEQRQQLADRLDAYMERKYGFVLGTADRDVYIDSLLHVIGAGAGE